MVNGLFLFYLKKIFGWFWLFKFFMFGFFIVFVFFVIKVEEMLD